jgi:dTMP kinase
LLLVVTGADGAGKTSITRRLQSKLDAGDKPVDLIDRWDIFNNDAFPECKFIGADVKQIKASISSMDRYSRSLFIIWKIFTVMKNWQNSDDKLAIIDSYWIKHAAVEVEYGVDEQFVFSIVDRLPKPDAVVVLDVSPETAYERKSVNDDFVPYECGMDATLSKRSFIHHQSRLRDRIQRWADIFSWDVVDASKSADETVSKIERLILKHRNRNKL